ncbi:uncharacterized protein [Paramisgurnus dabryanus]|uniref:uncharacterized protein n=1 Tax=Paramisgurnus dabryanus TaxID=90735 RepID=UPI003CCF6EA2
MCVNVFVCSGVFGDEVKSVSVMEGDSLTLHIDMTDIQKAYRIQWRFGHNETRLATINKENNSISIYDDVLDGRFRDRLQMNNQTGDLTITNITTQHTGLYNITIKSKQKPKSYRFNVTVYAHLPIPVITTQNSSQCSNCSLLCSVLNVRDVSLSWYKGNCLLSIISVSDLNIRLSLPLEVEYQDTNTYSCVLNNNITNQTQHLNITQLCQTCPDITFMNKLLICCAVVGCLMIVVAVLIFCIDRKNRNTQQHVQTGEEEITYTETTLNQKQRCKPSVPMEDNVLYDGVKIL